MSRVKETKDGEAATSEVGTAVTGERELILKGHKLYD